jgi:uncharacterized protein YcbK (DUF882 family)
VAQMKWFKPAEFACKDGTHYPEEWVDTRLRPFIEGVLDPIREAYGEPLVVTSGYRTKFWNHAVGGARDSRHMHGDAADIAPKLATRTKVKELRDLVKQMEEEGKLPLLGGFGAYERWIHVDTRPRKGNGEVALWVGNGIGSEKT